MKCGARPRERMSVCMERRGNFNNSRGRYGLTALLAVLFSDGFVIWGGIFGGALIYVLLQAALTAVFALSAGMVFKKKKGEVG